MSEQVDVLSKISIADGDAPWLVFGNSLVTDLSIFDGQMPAFSGRFNILRYDQRGHGGTALGREAVGFDLLSDDLLALMDHHNIERCIYIGLSMGVPTGLAAYAKAPERFQAMVLIDGQAGSAPAAAAQWQARIDEAAASGMAAFAAATVDRWLKDGASASQVDELQTMIAATSYDGFAACAGALKSYDYRAAFQDLACPVQMIAGALDGGMPTTMKTLADAHQLARFAAVPGVGHVPCFEDAQAVNAILRGFFDQIGVLT